MFEDSPRKIVVTYPGRFQPFHKGHRDVFANLQKRFGVDNVFIVTGNKTDAYKSPFNFSDKIKFITAMGVPADRVIETDKVYDLPLAFQDYKDQVVFVTVVGEPDAKRLNPGATKKDGSPSYFQRMPTDARDLVTADKHGYVVVEPEQPQSIAIGGKTYDVSHGTPTRELWNQVRNNPQQRNEFLAQLYGNTNPELGATLDKIPTGAEDPAPQASPKLAKVKPDAVAKKPQAKLSSVKIPKPEKIAAVKPKKVEKELDEDPQFVGKWKGTDPASAAKVKYVGEDAGGVGVVKNGNDPRYVMATTGNDNDVDANTLGKMMKSYNLIGKNPANTKQTPVTGRVGQGLKESVTVTEAKNLHKRVKIVKGPDAGKYGYIRQIEHGQYKGAPKKFDVDIEGGGQANGLPATALRLAKEQDVAEAFIAPALSAANANAEYERTRTHLGGYKGRVDTEVSSKEEFLSVGKALQRAAKQSGQHVEYGLSDNKMSIFSDSMNSDELDEFIDNALESLQEGVAEAFANPGSGSTGTSRGAKRIANTVRKALAKNAETPEQRAARKEFEAQFDAERRKQQGMAEGEYDSRKPFGVRYKVFAGREGRMTTKEYWTTSSEKLEKAVAKIEALGNFYEIDGYSYPKEKQGVAEGGFKNLFAEFSGYGKYMQGRAPGVFNKFGLQVVSKEYSDDDNIQTYVVRGDRDSIAKAGQYLERNEDFGGYHLVKPGMTEAAGEQKFIVSYHNSLSDKSYTVMVSADDEYDAGDKVRYALGRGDRVTDVKPARGNEPTDEEYKVFVDPRNSAGHAGIYARQQGVAEGRVKELDMDLKSMPDQEFLAKYNRTKTQVRTAMKNESIIAENAEELNLGDDVVITGPVEFKGKTGVITDFGTMKRFVVVDLYNHGKHSFHSSDVSFNEYAGSEEEENDWQQRNESGVDEGMYQYDKQDPYNSEFAPDVGMGRMTLRGWKQSLIQRVTQLAADLSAAGQDIDKSALWDRVYSKMQSMNMDPIAKEIELAHQELERIRRQGGTRARAFKK
jgi:hypothetical protein